VKSENIQKIILDIKENCNLSKRSVEDVILIGASKSQTIEKIIVAYEEGIKNFGENYLQEAEEKISKLDQDIIWHFIGSIQSRKAKRIAEIFDWVHTIDSFKVAEKLNSSRPKSKGALNACLQLNIDDEESKSGLKIENLEEIIQKIEALENLKIRGLMVIPKPRDSEEEQREVFRKVKEIYDSLIRQGHNFDTLSMGMTSDYGIAIQEGATMIRIGTGIFGPRI
jgi:pyridoxal phosphate enzyme (YggS family)